MRVTHGRTFVGLISASLLVACGSAPDPDLASGDPVDATPRALAAVLIDHVHGAEPRRETGAWSDYNDPRALSARVDYGVDPEGGESGETRTVRIAVTTLASYPQDSRDSLTCRAEDPRCEQEAVDGGTIAYRWNPGGEEEEPGTYSWTVVRGVNVVAISYEGSGLFAKDPRTLDLAIDPQDLRAAALDPAMSLRTTTGTLAAGQALTNYDGPEKPPTKPVVAVTTPADLAQQFEAMAEQKALSVQRSTRTDFGPDAVAAHLEYAGTATYEPFSVDVFTTVGKVPQLDPPPCGVQRSATAVRDRCFGLDENTYVTWTLARGDRPGVLWVMSIGESDDFNRVESSGIRFESTGLTEDPYSEKDASSTRFPWQIWSSVLYLTFEPERRVGPSGS